MSKPIHVDQSGPPPQAPSQREFVLQLLREAGKTGINREHFLFGTGPCNGRRVTQVGARIDELEAEGFVFESRWAKEGDQFVTYWLISEPVVRRERPKFREKKSKRQLAESAAGSHLSSQANALQTLQDLQQPRHVVALAQTFGPDAIGVKVYGVADGEPVEQQGLFTEPRPAWRDPEQG